MVKEQDVVDRAEETKLFMFPVLLAVTTDSHEAALKLRDSLVSVLLPLDDFPEADAIGDAWIVTVLTEGGMASLKDMQ